MHLADGVLTLTMDRPAVLNAMTGEMNLALSEQLERAASDDDVRVVVVTGAGDAFGTGADIGGTDAHERFDARAMEATTRLIRAVVGCDKPVVAAVNGIAAGVSASLALACDVIVVRHSAAFLLPFSRIGFMVDGGTSYAVATLVRRLAAGAPLAQAATKRAINAATLAHLDAALDREAAGQTLLMRTDDVAEGMRAFSERRRPVFRGE